VIRVSSTYSSGPTGLVDVTVEVSTLWMPHFTPLRIDNNQIRRRLLATAVLTVWLLSLAFPSAAQAGCCRVVRVDPETADAPISVCEPGDDGQCGVVLFVGDLPLGAAESICSAHPTILYQVYDGTADIFSAEIEAVCEGRDVEL